MATLTICANPECKATILVTPCNQGRRKYCSRRCRDEHAPLRAPKHGEHISPATEFKRGNRPQTWVPIGSTAEMKDRYIKVKIAEPNTWCLRSHLVWEKHHGRSLPVRWIIRRKDGDPQNDAPSNLIAMSRSRHLLKTLEDPAIERRARRRAAEAIRIRHQNNRMAKYDSFYWDP